MSKASPSRTERLFWKKVAKRSKEECWDWMASKTNTGYGSFMAPGFRTAHRFVYVLMIGPIPKGKELHHKCNNPLCVNPHHLEALTPEEHLAKHAESCVEFGRKGGLAGSRADKFRASAKAAIQRKAHALKIEHNGKALSIPDWSRETGIPKVTIWWRLRKGWTTSEALSTKAK